MGTQRKNDATYSHPWRDYFPIEGAIKQLSNYLKQEMFIFQTSTFDEMLLKLAWESNNFTGHIVWNRICFSLQKIYCFIYFIITRKIKLKQPHHCWCMDTTYNCWKCHFLIWVFFSSAVVFLLHILRTTLIKNKGYNI